MKMNKKGQVGGAVWSLVGVAVAFVVVALVLAFGVMILGDTQDDMTASSVEYNATGEGIDAVAKVSAKLPIIATVIVAVIIIGLLIAGFAGFMTKR